MSSCTVLAIDPGTTTSAIVLWDGNQIIEADIARNEHILNTIRIGGYNTMVIEQIKCYGMVVGESILETVFWSGRFWEACPVTKDRIPRMDVKQISDTPGS